jgi:predicted DNA-binding transcriptional regulator AlpA
MKRWSIMIDTAALSDDPHRLDRDSEELVERFRARLQARDPDRVGSVFVVIEADRYGAQFSFACSDPAKATTIGTDLFVQAAEEAGLPSWPIVGVQALAAAQSRDFAKPAVSSLVGTAEATAVLGVSRRRLTQLSERPDFPRPVAVTAATPVWLRTEIQAFKQAWPRRTGRPPKAREVA